MKFRKNLVAAILSSILFSSCGSSDTVTDRDVNTDALTGAKPDGSDSKVFGDAILQGEEVEPFISCKPPFKEGSKSVWSHRISAGREFVVSSKDLGELNKGSAELRISRIFKTPVSQGHGAGDSIRTEYEGAAAIVEILP